MLSDNFKEVEMSNIIEDLYYNNLEPQELQIDITPKLKEKLKILSNKEEQLRERLTAENLELFNDYAMCCTELSCLSCVDAFISGFKIGGRIINETFSN